MQSYIRKMTSKGFTYVKYFIKNLYWDFIFTRLLLLGPPNHLLLSLPPYLQKTLKTLHPTYLYWLMINLISNNLFTPLIFVISFSYLFISKEQQIYCLFDNKHLLMIKLFDSFTTVQKFLSKCFNKRKM